MLGDLWNLDLTFKAPTTWFGQIPDINQCFCSEGVAAEKQCKMRKVKSIKYTKNKSSERKQRIYSQQIGTSYQLNK